MPPRRVRVGWTPDPRDVPYEPTPTAQWLAGASVPDIVHHRSAYLHTVNAALEEVQDRPADSDSPGQVPDDELKLWRQVLARLRTAAILGRDEMDDEHRSLLWVASARLHFFANRRLDQFKRAHQAPLLSDVGLRVSDAPVRTYTVRLLWRALMVLTEHFGALPYTPQLRDYVDALALQCGRFFWITSADRGIFDHRSFVCRVGAGAGAEWRVNERFISETERIFDGLYRAFEEREALERYTSTSAAATAGAADAPGPPPQPTALAAEERRAVGRWLLGTMSNTALREFVNRDFQTQIYDWSAFVGERERYAKSEPFNDSSAFNAIAKYRPDVIDDIADMFERNKFIESTLERAVAAAPERGAGMPLDIDAQELAVIIAGHAFDEGFASEEVSFQNYFAIRPPRGIPVAARGRDAANVRPFLVRAHHEYHVWDRGALVRCGGDALLAIAEWLRALCDTDALDRDDVQHVVSDRDIFYRAYRVAHGGRQSAAELAEHAAQEQRSHAVLFMPTAYKNDRKRPSEA